MITAEFEKLFHSYDTPVVAAYNDSTVYFNPAAEKCLGELLKQKPSFLFIPDGTVVLGGTEYSVTAKDAFEHRIYFLSPVSPVSSSQELLRQISFRLKDKIADLKLVTSKMIPYIENSGDDTAAAYCRSIAKTSAVLHRMVGNLGFFQSFDRVSFSPTEFDMVQCLRDIADSVPIFVGDRCPEIIFSCSESSITVQADKEKLELAVYQLLSNSIKFTPKDGKITISLTCDSGSVTIAIADNGCGIDEKQLAEIWDIGNDSLSPLSGVGVGLPMVRHIARLHGGQALISSGKSGTCVTIAVPKVQTDFDTLSSVSAKYESGLSDLMLQLSEVIPAEHFSSQFMD